MLLSLMQEQTGGSRYQVLQTRARKRSESFEKQLEWSGAGMIPRPTYAVPECYRYPLDDMFWELHQDRPVGMEGSMRIPYEQIEAFARRKQITLSEWEAETIVAMDAAWFYQMKKETAARKN